MHSSSRSKPWKIRSTPARAAYNVASRPTAWAIAFLPIPCVSRTVEVDVLRSLGVAVGEMGVDIYQPRHHEATGMVDLPVGLGPARRAGLRADIGEPAGFVEYQDFAQARLVLASREQAAATDEGV